MYITKTKTCYCHTCKKPFHWLGITRHRVEAVCDAVGKYYKK